MSKILVYTFRTFPYIKELKNEFQEVIVLGKLKDDIDMLCTKIIELRPKFVLGIAKSNRKKSYFEPLTINKFNKSNQVIKHTNKDFFLYVPNLNETNFLITKNPTTSFCNYSMYKVQNFLDENNLEIHFSFTHINQEDINSLKQLFSDAS